MILKMTYSCMLVLYCTIILHSLCKDFHPHFTISGISSTSSIYGPATTVYLWTQVAGGCNGTEATLYKCPRLPTAVSCTSANPAAVRCSSPCKGITHVVHYGWTDYCSIQIQANMAHMSGMGHTANKLVDMSHRNLASLLNYTMQTNLGLRLKLGYDNYFTHCTFGLKVENFFLKGYNE